MKLNLTIASLAIIGIFGFSSTVLAQKTTNKAQAKTGTKAATAKKAKNPTTGETASPNTTNTRPPSTGTGNNTRPPSTGESLSEIEKVVRQLALLRNGATISQHLNEDSGSNLARTKGYIEQAETKADAFYNAVQDSNPSSDWSYDYNAPQPETMIELKNNLQKALNNLNSVQFEVGENHRLSAIDFTERAINQIDAYLISPPQPGKKTPKGAKPAKNVGNSQSNDRQQMTNPNGVDTTLKTSPAGSSEDATPAKPTTKKPKAKGETKKTNGLKGELTTVKQTPKKKGKN